MREGSFGYGINLRKDNLEVIFPESAEQCMSLQVVPSLIDRIKEGQAGDAKLQKFRAEVESGLRSNMVIHEDGSLRFGSRLCVPTGGIRQELLADAHSSPYSIHPGGTKMYRDLKQHFWWHGMKREITRFVSKYLVCQQVKTEHQRTAGLLQPLPIPE